MKTKVFIWPFLFNLFLTMPLAVARAQAEIRIASDGERVVAIGDIHGDFGALVKILRKENLIGPDGQWIGGKAKLVLIGDLVDRGPDSLRTASFVQDLQSQAEDAGGKLFALIGNHETNWIEGDLSEVKLRELNKLSRDIGAKDANDTLKKMIFSDGPLAEWWRNRPTIVQIDDTIFMHGSLEPPFTLITPERINAFNQKWMAYKQRASRAKPAKDMIDLFDDKSPTWSRIFDPSLDSSDILSAADLDAYLAKYNAKRIVVGHMPLDDILLQHPVHDKRVVMIDTAISKAMKGQLSALEIVDGKPQAHNYIRNRPAEWVDAIAESAWAKLVLKVGCPYKFARIHIGK